jgi:methylmalonyl-CoA mutase, N-terminal domain
VLGGVQSLHTNSMDETLALPSENAVMVALRTQQIIAEESGVTNTVDPLGGSYAIEALTNRIEAEALDYIEQIDRMGGIIRAIEVGFPQKEIAEAAYHFQRQFDRNEKVMVGVNRYQNDDKPSIDILRIHAEVEERQTARVRAFKAARDQDRVTARLAEVREACRDGANLMPRLIAAVKDGVTLGEVCDVYRDEFGVYRDPAWI